MNFRMETTGDASTLDLFGSIGGSWLDDFDERDVAAAINQLPLGNALTVRINSPGGSVFAALAIKRLLEARATISRVAIEVIGIAASAATLITCAVGIPVRMATGSTMLIHPVRLYSDSGRTPEELREAAEGLEKIRLGIRDIYAAKTGQSAEALDALMGKESYLTAPEAVELHFADALLSAPETADGEDAEAVVPDRICAKAGETCAADLDRIRAALLALHPAADAADAAASSGDAGADAHAADVTPKSEEKAADDAPPAEPEKIESRAAEETAANPAELIRDAVAAERERIAAIDEMAEGLRGCDDLIRAAKADGSSAGAFAIAALKRLKTFSAVALGARLADAESVADLAPATGNFGAADSVRAEEKAEDANLLTKIIEAGKRGFIGGK